ncbi:MAG: hypothetical protein ACJ754_11560 [Pyrinomonadaceae bacterium]
MVRLKSDLNPEEERGFAKGPTKHKTPVNKFEVPCGMCGGIYYVDEETSERIGTAVEKGLDNPFVCEESEQEYEERAHAG